MMTLEQFIEQNETDLKNMYDIFKYRVETNLSFKGFCKFCYEHTL